jgi:hypothetical protein
MDARTWTRGLQVECMRWSRPRSSPANASLPITSRIDDLGRARDQSLGAFEHDDYESAGAGSNSRGSRSRVRTLRDIGRNGGLGKAARSPARMSA